MVPRRSPAFPWLLYLRVLPVPVLLGEPWSVWESLRVGTCIVKGKKSRRDHELVPTKEQGANQEHTIGGEVNAKASCLKVRCVHTNGKHRRVSAMHVVLPWRRGYTPAVHLDPLTTREAVLENG